MLVLSQGVQNGDDVPHHLVVLSHLQTARYIPTHTLPAHLVEIYPGMSEMGVGECV